MGGLHKGHQELINKAQNLKKNQSSSVIVSIFVNPLQFGPKEDFTTYPRELEKDILYAKECGAEAIWIPSSEDIYPGGINSNFQVKAPYCLTSKLCGAKRKGHFDGVATVIMRLLSLLKPNVLILGEKDWQQFIILRQLIKDFNISVKIETVATLKERDGVPYSSRNRYLNGSDRKKIAILSKSLTQSGNDFFNGKQPNLSQIKSKLSNIGLHVEYLEIVEPYSLKSLNEGKQLSLLAAAVHCGNTRLIDHTFLMNRNPIVAIDGPAGAGKSTVTKSFAEKTGLIYLDTGAMYRAVTWLIQQEKIDPTNTTALSTVLENLDLEIKQTLSAEQRIYVNKKDVTESIRNPEVTSLVSIVAAQKLVREALTKQQRSIGSKGGLVAEGRDIGTSVFPDAELKIFLTATSLERAKRRANDLKSRGYDAPEIDILEKEIKDRDEKDSTRKISPLIKAQDAIEIVTDGMNIEEVVQALIDLFRDKVPKEVWPNS